MKFADKYLLNGNMYTQSANTEGEEVQGITAQQKHIMYKVYDGRSNASWVPQLDWSEYGSTEWTVHESICCFHVNYQSFSWCSEVWCPEHGGNPCYCNGGTYADTSVYTGKPTGKLLQGVDAYSTGGAAVIIPFDNAEAVGLVGIREEGFLNANVLNFTAETFSGNTLELAHRTDLVFYGSRVPSGQPQNIRTTSPNPLGFALNPTKIIRGTTTNESYSEWQSSIVYCGNQVGPQGMYRLELSGSGTTRGAFPGSQYFSIPSVSEPCRTDYPAINQGVSSAMRLNLAGEETQLVADFPPELKQVLLARTIGFA